MARMCRAGDTGEIWLRGPGLMLGYFRDAAATAQVMRPGGWYATGDLGRFGDDGALFVVGRLKEMIIRSGFNVYPAEIEAVIGRFEGVHLCAVVGVPEADGNEQIVAFVELKPGAVARRGRVARAPGRAPLALQAAGAHRGDRRDADHRQRQAAQAGTAGARPGVVRSAGTPPTTPAADALGLILQRGALPSCQPVACARASWWPSHKESTPWPMT
jgi:acyl-CoA synthetase (AMP-forming)/AMP-acid ligase II